MALSLVNIGTRVEITDDALIGNPGSTLPGDNMQDIHGVDFLEGTALGLVDEEEDDKDTDNTAGGKHVAVGKVDGARDKWGEEGDQEVPCPVGTSGNANACGAAAVGVHLRADGPDDGTPRWSLVCWICSGCTR